MKNVQIKLYLNATENGKPLVINPAENNLEKRVDAECGFVVTEKGQPFTRSVNTWTDLPYGVLLHIHRLLAEALTRLRALQYEFAIDDQTVDGVFSASAEVSYVGLLLAEKELIQVLLDLNLFGFATYMQTHVDD